MDWQFLKRPVLIIVPTSVLCSKRTSGSPLVHHTALRKIFRISLSPYVLLTNLTEDFQVAEIEADSASEPC